MANSVAKQAGTSEIQVQIFNDEEYLSATMARAARGSESLVVIVFQNTATSSSRSGLRGAGWTRRCEVDEVSGHGSHQEPNTP